MLIRQLSLKDLNSHVICQSPDEIQSMRTPEIDFKPCNKLSIKEGKKRGWLLDYRILLEKV
jgi:hypothetical protein